MNRQSTLLAGLAFVLVIVLFYFFAWKPKSEELAEVRAQTDEVILQQGALETRIRELQAVRAEAPSIESTLAGAESLIPREAALPSALRQLQLAADDSGVELISISPGRPGDPDPVGGVSAISLALTVNGGYFQVVDFLRRVEDPAIVPRAIILRSMSVSIEEYPTLAVSLAGDMFAVLPAAPVAEPATPAPTATELPTEPVATEEPAA